MSTIRVRVSPGTTGPDAANPYLNAIYSRMSAMGIEPVGWRESSNATLFDIIHIHWPNLLLGSKPRGLSRARGLAWLSYLRLMRRRGAKVVWTAHNLRPHRMVMTPREWDSIFERFTANVDGVVHLSQASVDIVNDAYPSLERLPTGVIPHPHYLDVVDPAPEAERDAPLRELLCVGRVQRYKELEAAVEAVGGLATRRVHLTVAGRCEEAQLKQDLADRSGRNVRLDFRHVPDDELSVLAGRHDAILVPQTNFLNSGVIFLALSLGRPAIVARTPVTQELQKQFGSAWIRLFEPPLDPSALHEALGITVGGRPDLRAIDPGRIAESHARFYERLTRSGHFY